MGGSGGSSDFGTVGRSSGGGSGGGRTSGDKNQFDCELYRVTTTLRSPKSEALNKLKKDERLPLQLTKENAIVAVTTKPHKTVGSIVVPDQNKLVACMKNGTEYTATVLSIEGGACVVEVAAEPA